MKKKLLLLVVTALLLQNCSWRIRFFIVNSGDDPLQVEIKLKRSPGTFPIFHYRKLVLHEAPEDRIKDDTKELLADTLEDYSHFAFSLPAHTAVEIGQLQNDNYEKYNQYFINGRVFNLETLVVKNTVKETKVIPETFDAYFKKGKSKEVYYYVK